MPGVKRGAHISDCGKYRYRLWREWDASLPRLAWIRLNPSTADGTADDPTIRKCTGFAKRLGLGGIEVFNLFAFRATKPADLFAAGCPIGPETDETMLVRLLEMGLRDHGFVIAAWGAHARGCEWRVNYVRYLLSNAPIEARALRLLSDGTPAHPLMLPYSCRPVSLCGEPVEAAS